MLADIGISVGLISIGGRVWQDQHRFGQLINTALGLRKRLGIVVIVAVTPILYFMLQRMAPLSLISALLIRWFLPGF